VDAVGRVGDRGGDAVLVPADAFLVDCVLETVLVVIEEVGKIGRELFGEHAAQYRARAVHGRFLGFGKFVGGGLFSYQSADFVHEKKRCRDEQCESDNRDRCEGGHAGMVARRGRKWPLSFIWVRRILTRIL